MKEDAKDNTGQTSLSLEATYNLLVKAAKEKRFVSYGEIAVANSVHWPNVWHQVPQHLDALNAEAHQRGWPLISAIVVRKENLQSGLLDGESLNGFVTGARNLGLQVDDPEAFLRDQQEAVFDWAAGAEEHVQFGASESTEPSHGPRFVRYFAPVVDALRALGGKATPAEVMAWIREQGGVSNEDLEATTKGGQSRFENDVGWARFYLVKAGFIDASVRGTWSLTAEGNEAHLTHERALVLFKEVYARFANADQEDEVAPDPSEVQALFEDPNRQFWFVGAAWGGTEDQLERFLADGIWENGYDEKFSDHIKRMRPGDRIAIKAAFVQRYNLPFENHAKPVSCMRIKATGVITDNPGDGKFVKVDWHRVEPPRDWFFYTYRVTLVQADPSEDLARRLILFTFAGAKQDYDFWINEVPYFAKKYRNPPKAAIDDELAVEDADGSDYVAEHYSIENILADGCFLAGEQLDGMLARLEAKKNIILQGPPGTGKTWLAKKLAYVLLGSKERKVTQGRLRMVQFHPSLSYEDFVRGWRPAGDGRLELIDGVFLECVDAARAEPDQPFVLIIEEINRGNPAQIFGEMLTLLENSKRRPEEALELAYRREEDERVFVPANLHVIGTMNVADRSLALVDLALRRRFAFIDLEPQLGASWKQWCTAKCGLDEAAVTVVGERIAALNAQISEDRSLGPQYRVGHSFVTPLEGDHIDDAWLWYCDAVETEIAPLLDEYWFDAPEKVDAAKRTLLAAR